jgi:hypothetical protein
MRAEIRSEQGLPDGFLKRRLEKDEGKERGKEGKTAAEAAGISCTWPPCRGKEAAELRQVKRGGSRGGHMETCRREVTSDTGQ